VVNQVGKRLTVQGDPETGAVREVGGTQPAGLMHLAEEHFLGRSVFRPPLFDAALQGPQLTIGKTTRLMALQPREQRPRFQSRVEEQLLLDQGPGIRERIEPRSPGMFHAHLTGQLAEPPILACRLRVDTGLGGCLSFEPTLLIEAVQTLNMPIGDHPKPPCRKGFG
jgi:hypothetical protein